MNMTRSRRNLPSLCNWTRRHRLDVKWSSGRVRARLGTDAMKAARRPVSSRDGPRGPPEPTQSRARRRAPLPRRRRQPNLSLNEDRVQDAERRRRRAPRHAQEHRQAPEALATAPRTAPWARGGRRPEKRRGNTTSEAKHALRSCVKFSELGPAGECAA